MEKKTLKQFIKENATVTKYAFGNRTNKEFWKGYKKGWIACIENLLLEADDKIQLQEVQGR